jgi:hypothetical protein
MLPSLLLHKGGHPLSPTTHLVLSIPYLVAPPWLLLKLSAAKIVSHQHLEKWRRRFWRIPTSAAPLDRGHGGYHQTVRVTEYGGATGCGTLYTILRLSSEQLRRLRMSSSSIHWQHLCRNVKSRI